MAGGFGAVVGGIPVRVDPSFLLISLVIGLAGGRGVEGAAVWLAVVGASVLVHEFGHALTFRLFGVPSSVVLYAMGGLTIPEGDRRLSTGQNVAVSLAGPGVGMVLGGLVALLAPPGQFGDDSLARLASLYLLFVNLGWGLVNLLPILPLDGGNVMAAILERAYAARGLRAARILSLVFAGGLGALALAYRQPFVALLAFWFGSMNLGALRGEGEAPRTSPAEEILLKGAGALRSGNHEGARWAARHVLDDPSAPAELRAAAAELLAWTALAMGSVASATAALAAAPEGHPAGALVRACVELARDGAAAAAPALATGLREGSRLVPAELVASSISAAGALDDVVEHLLAAPDGPRAAAGLARLQEILHHAGRYGESVQVGEAAFARSPDGVVAFNTACSLARAGREEDALEWLSRAVDAGWDELSQLDADQDLVSLRGRPRFVEVRGRLATRPAGGRP